MKLISKFNKKDLWNVPNILCYIRFLLIPVFVILYLRANTTRDYIQVALIILLSGFTDFLDGFIARRYHLVTEWGKMIDPLADKLTQAALLFVMVLRIKGICFLIIIFVLLQVFLLVAGLLMLKKGKKLSGAMWFGKVSTTVFYAVMFLLVALPSLSNGVIHGLIMICGGFLMLSFCLYGREYILMYRQMRYETSDETSVCEKE